MPTVRSKGEAEENSSKRRSKRKAKTPEPISEPDEEKVIKTEESDTDDTVLSDRPGTGSNESVDEIKLGEAHKPEDESCKIATNSPVPVKEESQDSDKTESEEDEL